MEEENEAKGGVGSWDGRLGWTRLDSAGEEKREEGLASD